MKITWSTFVERFNIPLTKRYSRIEHRKCPACGRKMKIYHNLYGSPCGGGSCSCGLKVTIN